MNTITAIVNLTSDPETLTLGEAEAYKLRVADNTFGKNNETRYIDVLLTGKQDKEVASRLKKGDQIVVTGTLTLSSYKAKKASKYHKKGDTVRTDNIPFGRILQVTKSPSFFNQDVEEPADDDVAEDTGSTEAPDLGTEESLEDSLV